MKTLLASNTLRKLINLKLVEFKHMHYAILLLVFALLIKLVVGTDFCQLEQTKCLGRPHIGCLRNFPVQLTHQSECLRLSKHRLSNELKQFIVTEHNKIRNAVALGTVPTFPSASRMLEMSWDDELEELACAHNKFCTEPLNPSSECRATYSYNLPGENSYANLNRNVVQFIDQALRGWTSSTLSNPNDNSFRRILKERNSKVGCCLASYQSARFGFAKLLRISCMYSEDANPYEVVYNTGPPNSKCLLRNVFAPSTKFPALCASISQQQPLSMPPYAPIPFASPLLLHQKQPYDVYSQSSRRLLDPSRLKNIVSKILNGGDFSIESGGGNVKRRQLDLSRLKNIVGKILNGGDLSLESDGANVERRQLDLSKLKNFFEQVPKAGRLQIGPDGAKFTKGDNLRRKLGLPNLSDLFNQIPNEGHLNIGPDGVKFRRQNRLRGMAMANAGFNLLGNMKNPSQNSGDDYSDLKKQLKDYDYSDEEDEGENYDDVEGNDFGTVQKSWTSMEKKTLEKDFPIEMSAMIKTSSCDINGVIVEGPMTPEDCMALMRQKALSGFNMNAPQPQIPMNPYPNLGAFNQPLRTWPQNMAQSYANQAPAYFNPYYSPPQLLSYPSTTFSQAGSYPNIFSNVRPPVFRRSIEKTKETSSESSEESPEQNEKSKETGSEIASLMGGFPKMNVNIQSGHTSVNGEDVITDADTARRQVPKIFEKVFKDLGLK